ncbi:MAG: hypothetical protein GQ556_07420 [Desulfobacterales bacterium]|nr:hypothetical protein [Desulfobacterales bacterium]
MPVSEIGDSNGSVIVASVRQKESQTSFADILNKAATAENKRPSGSGGIEKPDQPKPGETSFVELGRISKETPTVSHILKNHPELSEKCWNIINTPENKGKQYRRMTEGTVVALKKDSNELVWGRELSALTDKNSFNSTGSSTVAAQDIGQSNESADSSIVIGTISKANPTVSHLFQSNPDFDNRFWNIINSPVNISKEYESLRPGTQVSLNPKTMEISFGKSSKSPGSTYIAQAPQKNDIAETGGFTLADAVKPYIGTSYKKIDCYGLIVRGLSRQGVQYWGKGGLREKLENLAKKDGLPGNAYFNGESLVEKAGTKIYSKSLLKISNSREKAEQVYSEIRPHLQKGLILSFSTPTRGHTGVVSRQGDEWTYINSGLIDNQISHGKVSERVGEERLKAEIKNWFNLAANRKESLTVTLGLVNKG